jgi:ubiquinone/menaquinone biosynthesis C-methylase UbiE
MPRDVVATNLSHYRLEYQDHYTSHSFEVRNKERIVWQLLSKFHPDLQGVALIDVGFGHGRVLLTATRMGAHCVGIELVWEALAQLRRHTPHIPCVQGDVQALPFRSDIFDVVICSHVLEHVSDDIAGIKELYRIAKPGGLILIGVPMIGFPHSELHFREYDHSGLHHLRAYGTCLVSRQYGSRILRGILAVIAQIAARIGGSGGQFSVDNSSWKTYVIKFLRRLYHKVFVPLLLIVADIDDYFAQFESSPMELWLVIIKNRI